MAGGRFPVFLGNLRTDGDHVDSFVPRQFCKLPKDGEFRSEGRIPEDCAFWQGYVIRLGWSRLPLSDIVSVIAGGF